MKENDGRRSRRLLIQKVSIILLCFSFIILLITTLGIGKASDSPANNSLVRNGGQGSPYQTFLVRNNPLLKRNRNRRQGVNQLQVVDVDILTDSANVDRILSASVHLVSIDGDIEELKGTSGPSYAGVYGEFCTLDFAIHKADPTAVPMFRDLVTQSPQCQQLRYRVDLHEIAELTRSHDRGILENGEVTPKSLPLAGVAFHESRCGSTLVANALIAMDPDHHRVYSESAPPMAAMRSICGETNDVCSEETAAKLLQDVVYLMGRTSDKDETNMFFKIQSIGTRNIKVFQKAFPETPWIFVYRDPVQVMMSQLAQGVAHANCVKTRTRPPSIVTSIIKRHGYHVNKISNEMYCAAHLASITESAVSALQRSSSHGTAVNYVDLPDILYTDILPLKWGIPVGDTEVSRILQVSSKYSKGRAGQGGEWREDSAHKEQLASQKVRTAADIFLQESYDALQQQTK